MLKNTILGHFDKWPTYDFRKSIRDPTLGPPPPPLKSIPDQNVCVYRLGISKITQLTRLFLLKQEGDHISVLLLLSFMCSTLVVWNFYWPQLLNQYFLYSILRFKWILGDLVGVGDSENREGVIRRALEANQLIGVVFPAIAGVEDWLASRCETAGRFNQLKLIPFRKNFHLDKNISTVQCTAALHNLEGCWLALLLESLPAVTSIACRLLELCLGFISWHSCAMTNLSFNIFYMFERIVSWGEKSASLASRFQVLFVTISSFL